MSGHDNDVVLVHLLQLYITSVRVQLFMDRTVMTRFGKGKLSISLMQTQQMTTRY